MEVLPVTDFTTGSHLTSQRFTQGKVSIAAMEVCVPNFRVSLWDRKITSVQDPQEMTRATEENDVSVTEV